MSARLWRRVFRCRKGMHRETLDMTRWKMKVGASPTLAIHEWRWRCLDCGAASWFAFSDNIEEERKAGRIV